MIKTGSEFIRIGPGAEMPH